MGISTQVTTPFTVHLVLPQVAPLPSATVVTLTTAVIDAEGATVTELAPSKVAEVIVRVAYTGVDKNNKGKIAKTDTKMNFRQNFDTPMY